MFEKKMLSGSVSIDSIEVSIYGELISDSLGK